jgi:uroporphyrin-III C-methyltransferase
MVEPALSSDAPALPVAEEETMIAKPGCVHLVGAGPGDPELLTLKARRLLDEADVVVYDRLVSDEILALVPPGTARISVGKQPRCHPIPQAEINELLVRLASTGRTVVRLKGGDPYLFGRGSEEAAYLRAHGVPFAVVPGVTSASGCAAAVGIPLTHRGLASGVRFVTGHCRDDTELDLDWRGLADPDTTLVIYMGMANIPQIAVRLIAHGLSESTPAAAIANGARPDQRHVISSLGEIAAVAASADLNGPVLFIIGRVVDMAALSGCNFFPANAEACLA